MDLWLTLRAPQKWLLCNSASSSTTTTTPQPSLFPFSPTTTFSTTTINSDDLAQSLLSEILKYPSSEPLPIAKRLRLCFSHFASTPTIILSALNLSSSAERFVLGFHQWLLSNPNFTPSDESTSYFINYLGRQKFFKAVDKLLAAACGVACEKSLAELVDRKVHVGRATEGRV